MHALDGQGLAQQEPPVCVAPGVHTPWPVQEDQVPQVQEDVQVRLWVPQFPQAWDCVAPVAHTPSPVQTHALHAPWVSQVRWRVPQLPQVPPVSVAPGEQVPSPSQVHSPQVQSD